MWDTGCDGFVRYDAASVGADVMGHVAENRLVAAALHDRLRARGGAVELLMPRGIAAAELPPYHPVAQVRLAALK